MTDRIPGAPGRCKAVVAGEELQKMQAGEEFAITLRRDDAPIKAGTPYSKAAVLPDEVAASLCPGVQDPTPGDAFGALQRQKADTVRRNAGPNIILYDATHTPLKGLRLFGNGQDAPLVGDAGSVSVSVTGKNLWEFESTIVPASNNNSGRRDYACLPVGIPLTLSADITKYPDDTATNTRMTFQCFYTDGTRTKGESDFDYDHLECDGAARKKSATIAIDPSKEIDHIECTLMDYGSQNGRNAKAENIQLEIGTAVTEYEPYQEPQTITVSTAAGAQIGLAGDGNVRDEIDFGRGVLIHRVFEEREYPLPEEVLEAYAKLHTYTPTTVITNNVGAEMEVTYYTSTTAVQMVHSPADKGKTFTVDRHGCVTLIKDNPVIACGETTVDGVTWYYRKWADGFAECWGHVFHGYDSGDGVTSALDILLPFSITGVGADLPGVLMRLYNNAYAYVDVGGVTNPAPNTISVVVTVPEDVLEDSYIEYEGDVYVTGYWKNPEVNL